MCVKRGNIKASVVTKKILSSLLSWSPVDDGHVPIVVALGFCPRGTADSSQARRALPQRGERTQPKGFNPGNRHPERRALKGRQIQALTTWQRSPIVARLNCAFYFLPRARCELYQVILSPLQGELVMLRFPGLTPWAEPCSHLRGINQPKCPSLSVQTDGPFGLALCAWLLSCCPTGTKTIHPSKRLALSQRLWVETAGIYISIVVEITRRLENKFKDIYPSAV